MKKRPNGDILLQKLFQKRVVLLRKTLRVNIFFYLLKIIKKLFLFKILCQTATNDANLARFKELYLAPNFDSEPIVPYVKEIVESFHIALSHFKTVIF